MGKMKYIYQLIEEENFSELSSILGDEKAKELIKARQKGKAFSLVNQMRLVGYTTQ